MSIETWTNAAFAEAVAHARRGADEAAKAAYLRVLGIDATHFGALNDLACLLHAEGRFSAARLAYAQAVALHPGNPIGRVNYGNLLYERGEHVTAEVQYRAALDAAPEFPQAHQGLARILSARGEEAVEHWRKGFLGHAIVRHPYRGVGVGLSALLLVSVKLGNMDTRRWITDQDFAITEIHVEFFDEKEELPDHALFVNAIGDADLCAQDLEKACVLASCSKAPIINAPLCVLDTGRVANDCRMSKIPGVKTAQARLYSRAALMADAQLDFPLLIRSPGFHTGRHFVKVKARDDLPEALESLPGEDVIVLDHLDARGRDGLFRKFRVMFVSGEIYPLHLAISRHWLVHYFSSEMAENVGFRAEEQRFLQAMPDVLGSKAMMALREIERELGLDFGGVDFGLAQDGSLLLFETNATMNVFPPDSDPKWDYRRAAVETILRAAREMTKSRALTPGVSQPSAPVPMC